MAPIPSTTPNLILGLRRFLSETRFSSSIDSLSRRQTTSIVAVPTTYGNLNDGPPPGTVAGIVLGSVAGFLLILWLLFTLFGGGGGYGNFGYTANDNVSSVVVREHRKSRGSRRSSGRRVSEVRERPSAPPVVIVEETRRSASRAPPPPLSEGDDEIVVIEEPDPDPRRDRRKERERERESGYRNVDPRSFGGGDRPLREVRKSNHRR